MSTHPTLDDRLQRGGLREGRPTLWVLALVLPITTVAPSFGGVGTIARTLLAAAVALVIFRRPARLGVLQQLLLLTFLAILAAQAIGAPAPGYGVARLVNWVMFMPFILVGASAERLALAGKSLLAACWIQMIGVALQLAGYRGGTWGGLLTSGTYYDPSRGNLLTRYTGFVENPNDLGLLLSLGAVTSVLIAASRVGVHRALPLLSAGVFVYGVLLTGSRGAIIALLVGVVSSLYFFGVRQRLFAVLAIALTGALFVARSTSFSLVLNSIGEIASGRDLSAAFRTNLWAAQIGVNDSWLFGDGFGGYARDSITDFGTVLDVDAAALASMTIDSSWLKLTLEGGLLSVVVLGVLLLSVLVAVLARFHREQPDSLATGAVFSCVAMILWRSLSADMLDINPWNGILWFGAGLAVGVANRSAEAPTAHGSKGSVTTSAGDRRAFGDARRYETPTSRILHGAGRATRELSPATPIVDRRLDGTPLSSS